MIDLAVMADPTPPALQSTGITKRFGAFVANSAVDFDVRWGEIHALLGENGAGKTTLMRIVTGMFAPDEGELRLDGKLVRFRKPEHAARAGIGMVHQHFTLVPNLTELANLCLRPAAVPWRNHAAAMRRRAEQVAAETGLRIDPHRLVADASIGERQRLEIVKLLCRDARILIFDEPSAALSPGEWDELAALMRRLADDGRAIVLISHKLSEVFATADRYTVLRNGHVAGSGDLAGVTADELVALMVGDAVDRRPPRRERIRGDRVLSTRGLSVPRHPDAPDGPLALHGVSLDVHRGEIVGVAGVAGSGQTELVEALLGLRRAGAGTVELMGRAFLDRSPAAYYAAGGGLIPEDRHELAIVGSMTLWENIALRAVGKPPLSRRGIVRTAQARQWARDLMAQFDVRADSEAQVIGRLSGGNQQKAVLAREFASEPGLLIAAQPVRGLDVRATDFVYRRLEAHRDAGGAVLLISMDLDEILALSDRVVVLGHGAVQGVLDKDEATRTRLGSLMTAAAA